MKKLLLLLLIAPFLGYGQLPNGLILNDIIAINALDYRAISNSGNLDSNKLLKVPDGKVWMITPLAVHTYNDTYIPSYYVNFAGEVTSDNSSNWVKIEPYSDYDNGEEELTIDTRFFMQPHLLPSGTTIAFDIELLDYNGEEVDVIPDDEKYKFWYYIYEYVSENNSLDGQLGLNELVNPKNSKILLFPNPTSSLLALNSDKEYDIEVYDMSGNKLMALTGNSINMEHLSTATYIVKATDKSNNEEMTYKVVKN